LIDLELVRVIMAGAMLSTASFFDLRSRSINDLVWIAFGAAAIIIYIIDLPDYGTAVLDLLSISIAAAVSFGIYRCGFFGGADMLGIIALAVILPTTNSLHAITVTGQNALSMQFAPLTVLANAAILSVAQIAYNIARNLWYLHTHSNRLFEGFDNEPTARKVLAIAAGYKSEKTSKYAFAIEKKKTGGQKGFEFMSGDVENKEFESGSGVWVTPGIPFMVYLLGGFVAMILVGNIATLFLAFLGFSINTNVLSHMSVPW
jgi:preflagellin peptidase FlaK